MRHLGCQVGKNQQPQLQVSFISACSVLSGNRCRTNPPPRAVYHPAMGRWTQRTQTDGQTGRHKGWMQPGIKKRSSTTRNTGYETWANMQNPGMSSVWASYHLWNQRLSSNHEMFKFAASLNNKHSDSKGFDSELTFISYPKRPGKLQIFYWWW